MDVYENKKWYALVSIVEAVIIGNENLTRRIVDYADHGGGGGLGSILAYELGRQLTRAQAEFIASRLRGLSATDHEEIGKYGYNNRLYEVINAAVEWALR